MEKEEIKYTYILDYLDFEDALNCLHNELGLKEGILKYYDIEKDGWVEEKLPIDELKKKAFVANSEDGYPTAIFEDIEVSTIEESEVEIDSKNELKLDGLDIDRVIKKDEH